MPGLVPGIHVFEALDVKKTWMAGMNPAMTEKTLAKEVREAKNSWLLCEARPEARPPYCCGPDSGISRSARNTLL